MTSRRRCGAVPTLDGTSMQEAARRAVREYVAKAEHRDRVAVAADLVMDRHAEALRRLGE